MASATPGFVAEMGAWVLAFVAGVVLFYAVVSRRLERTPVTAGIFFLSAGLAFGNKASGGSTHGLPLTILAGCGLASALFGKLSSVKRSCSRSSSPLPMQLSGGRSSPTPAYPRASARDSTSNRA